MAYLITYDLNKPGQNYTKLYEAIKALSGTHWHMMESVCTTALPAPATTLRDSLAANIDKNDKLLVAKLSEAAWQGISDKNSEWLKNTIEGK